MKRDLNFIKLFPHYSNVTEDMLVDPVVNETDSLDHSSDPLLKTIFAPDPDTGIPRSDLAIVMSKDSSPEISQYIRDILLGSSPVSDKSVDDPDFAIGAVKSRNERLSDYAERLRQMVQKTYPSNDFKVK